MSEHAQKIISILKEINPFEEINESTKLIECGIIDSLSLTLLIDYLENSFEIIINGDEYIPENFESVIAIERLILNKST